MWLFLFAAAALAADSLWDLKQLSKTPRTFEAPQPEPGVRAIFLEGPAYQGKPTRIFAYYGFASSKKNAAMVLIHGGGGTAFAEWVRLWNSRGYGAIALDTVGTVPENSTANTWNPKRARHDHSGPAGWGDFQSVDKDPRDQWPYHAVAAVILAHSWLRAQPEVDPKRIGVTGISWGGYLTSIVSSLDPRFRFAAPVYGCGFLGEDSAWLKQFASLGPQRAARWLELWDPSVYLPRNRIPMLWVTGTNDNAYPMGSHQKSYRLPTGPRSLAIRVRMPHNHRDGAHPKEIFAMADALLNHRAALPRILKQEIREGQVSAEFRAATPIAKAELNYTRDSGPWPQRHWETVPAYLDQKKQRAWAKVPGGATAWFLNLEDTKGLVASTEHQLH